MDFVSKAQLGHLKKAVAESVQLMSRDQQQEARLKRAMSLAMEFDYYTVASASDVTKIEAVSACPNGEVVAIQTEIEDDADAVSIKLIEANILNPNATSISPLLETVCGFYVTDTPALAA
jgi:hypothetical protein